MFGNVDKKLEKLGFKKTADNSHIVSYERYDAFHRFRQEVDLCHKEYGKHIIQSYDKDLFDTKGIGNTCVGLTFEETKLFLKKMKQKKWNKM